MPNISKLISLITLLMLSSLVLVSCQTGNNNTDSHSGHSSAAEHADDHNTTSEASSEATSEAEDTALAEAAAFTPQTDYTDCPQERSKMCTREYRPVCAAKDTQVRCVTTPCPSVEYFTAPNACVACSDPDVMGYHLQACPQE